MVGGLGVDGVDDKSLCGEISAYLAATFYAYQRGWTAIEFLAALGGKSKSAF